MADYQIPLSYVVNATVVPASKGLEPLQLGTILLLTDEEPVTALDTSYIISRTATSINQKFGTNSVVAKLGNAVFSQNPNILNADGYAIVAQYLQNVVLIPATAGYLTSVNLSSNLSAISLVTDGELTVTVDGSDVALTGIDCSSITTVAELAEVINELLTGATVEARENSLVITSDTTGATSSIALKASSGVGTDLYGSSYLDGANATATQGTAAITGPETTAMALERLSGEIYFEGIISARNLSSPEAIEASNYVEGMENSVLFLTDVSLTTLAVGGLFYQLQNNVKTRKLLYLNGSTVDEQKLNAKLFAAAFASRGMSVNYSGANSCLTMTYKDLVGVPVDTNISETVLAQCETIGADVYCSVEGLPKVISFRQGGLYFDQLVNQIWLRTAVQRTVANVLFTTRNKIPQTTAGVTTLVNAVKSVLNQGVINGMIGAGEWNSADTFGVLEDFHRGIRTFGYYVYFTPLSEQPQADREARKCPVISVACKEAGAIEHANILIYIEA